MPRNKAILLVILAVDLRVPTVLFRLDELIEPILQFLLRADRQVELYKKKKNKSATKP
jgi:hypothetical protein